MYNDMEYSVYYRDKKRGGIYHVKIEHDYEEDNVKAFHSVTAPNGLTHTLDISPYESDPKEIIAMLITFYIRYDYFPTRENANIGGPLEVEDVKKLHDEAAEYQFEGKEFHKSYE